MGSPQSGEQITPTQNLVAEIQADYHERLSLIEKAKSELFLAALLGGSVVWTVVEGGGAFIAGIQTAAALWEARSGAIALSGARDFANEAVALRAALAEHELATGEVYFPANALEATVEQEQCRPYDQEQLAGA